MNNWKEVPHLFANGKFKIRRKNHFNKSMVDAVFERNEFLKYELGKVIDPKLIARPIKDLNDKELLEVFEDYNFDYELTSVKWNEEGYFTIKTGSGNPSFVQYLYPDKFRFQLVLNLLEKGCYPFENTKDVIWRNENE